MTEVVGGYNFPERGITDLEKYASLIHRMIMTPGPDREGKAEIVRRKNPKIKWSMYLLNSSAHLPDPGEHLNNNHILYNEGETAQFIKDNPDSILIYADGEELAGQPILKNKRRDYQMFDISHFAWRKMMQTRVAALKARLPYIQRVWWDDLGVKHRGNALGDIKSTRFPSNAVFFPALLDWLAYGSKDVAAPAGLMFGGNLQAPPEVILDFQKAAKVMVQDNGNGPGEVTIEWGWVDHDGALRTGNWVNTFNKGKYVLEQGGDLDFFIQRDPLRLDDPQSDYYYEFRLALLSHKLLDEPGRVGVRVADNYKDFGYIPELYTIDNFLGAAKSKARQNGSWYERDFENFTVKVNPNTMKYDLVEVPPVINDPPTVPPVEPEPPARVDAPVTINLSITLPQSAVDKVVMLLDRLAEALTVQVEKPT